MDWTNYFDHLGGYEGSSEEIIAKYKADGFKVSLVTKDGESVQALN